MIFNVVLVSLAIKMNADTILISSNEEVHLLLDSFFGLPIDRPSMFFDLEGVRLGWLGSVSLITLYVAPLSTTYIIYVHVLGASAFELKIVSVIN